MKRSTMGGVLSISALAVASAVKADAFPQFDMRAISMGGTGVAIARPASAAMFNPAMLSAARGEDDFQLAFGVGVALSDPDELIDTADDLQDKIDNLQLLIDDLQANTPAVGVADSRLGELSNQTGSLLTDLDKLDGARISVGAGANVAFGVASPTIGFGVYSNVNVYATFGPTLSPDDRAYLDSYRAAFADSTLNLTDPIIDNYVAKSEVSILAVAVRETGLGFSHYFSLGSGGLSVGVAPKKITVTSYDYAETVDNFDSGNFDSDTYKVEDNASDFDLGAVYRWSNDSPWQAGVTVKNLKGNSFDTYQNGHQLELKRQVRAGFARNGETLAFAVDLDLVEYEGFDTPKGARYLSVGGEFDVSFFQLRAGYRTDLGNTDQANWLTLGIGLGPIDLAMVRSSDDLGGGIRIAFGW